MDDDLTDLMKSSIFRKFSITSTIFPSICTSDGCMNGAVMSDVAWNEILVNIWEVSRSRFFAYNQFIHVQHVGIRVKQGQKNVVDHI